MAKKLEVPALDEQALYNSALNTISLASKVPFVKVDRTEFLREHFEDSPYLEQILEQGPQSVFSQSTLRKHAKRIVASNTTKTAAVSFASGIPSNVFVMIPAGTADVVQYFGFAMRMAQQISYLYGEDDLFESVEASGLSEEAKVRVIAYLGGMFGAAGAAALIVNTSKKVGEQVGKKVAARALTKTVWYPVVKKTGAVLGAKITKKTVEKTVAKAMPVLGGAVSGGIAWASFKPMGNRLIDVFERQLNGEFDEFDELSPEFAKNLQSETDESYIIDGEVVDGEG